MHVHARKLNIALVCAFYALKGREHYIDVL